jgi:hypothetical protein
MATESPGEAHAGDGVDLASGNDSDTPTDAEGVGGDTDDEVPEGENYFGRASKEGAAPAGANPFAAASSAPEDDWAAQIAEAKAMVEAQRIAREKEEAIEREREKAAAELKGKTYEGRRKAGDPVPETNASGNSGGNSAHSRVRKMLKARRPLSVGGEKNDAPTSAATEKSPFAFGASLLTPPAPAANDTPNAASPFAGFSLLGSTNTGDAKKENAPQSATATTSPVAADRTDPPKRTGGVFARLSGAPVSFTSPETVVEEAVEVTDDEETNGEASDGEASDGEASDKGPPPAVPLFSLAPSKGVFANVGEKKSEEDDGEGGGNSTPTPFSTAATTGNRTPLAVELDL